jgi:transcriptional regulator with XRE-family HTH domain
MFSKVQNFRLEDLLAEGVVYSCEVGTLLGIVEVEQRFSALRISCFNHDVDVLGLSVSGDYAAASWALRQYDGSVTNAVIAEQYGCTCIRMSGGLIVEAWDFPACKAQLDAVAKIPPSSQLRQSVKVNGDLVRAHRIAQAMTQEELARKSDLSIRLIRSVENSNEVSQRSCRMIATALSVPCSTLGVLDTRAATQSLMAGRAKEYLEEVWNHENYSVIDTHLTNKFRFHHEVGVVCDRQEMKQRIVKFRESFGDFDFNVTSSLDFGSFVVCKWQVKMTHVGTWLGIEPTGVRVTVNGASWVHVVGEQFGDAWDFWDPGLVLSRLTRTC